MTPAGHHPFLRRAASPSKNGATIAGPLLAFLLLPCTAATTEEPPLLRLPIGLVTVNEDPLHASRVRGASLAVALANRAGEAATPRFALETAGVDGPWQTAATKARELLFERDCLALISPADGDTAHLMIQLAARFHVPVISLSEVSTLTRARVPWLFRMVPDARQQIAALVASIGLAKGASLAALVPSGRAGRSLRSDLEALARELSISFEPLIAVDPANSEWTRIRRMETGPLLLWLDPANTRQVLERLRRSRFQGKVLVPHGRLDDIFETRLSPGISLHTIRLFDPASSGANAFREAYRNEYQQEPDAAAACAYDATCLLIRAIAAAGPDRSSIRDWLADSHHEAGVTGEIAFDETGNRTFVRRSRKNPTSSPREETPPEEGQSP